MNSAEDKVRRSLAREFNCEFRETKLPVGKNIEGKRAFKKFDAVSEDKSIVALVKDLSAKNIPGNQTRHARLMRDLYYLSIVRAERKMMFLSKDFYNWFCCQADGVVAPGIEIRIIP